MKKLCLILFLFATFISIAQSKKIQIIDLTNRVDSLNQVLDCEKKINSSNTVKMSDLNSELIRNEVELIFAQENLKIKNDSLVLLRLELNKINSIVLINTNVKPKINPFGSGGNGDGTGAGNGPFGGNGVGDPQINYVKIGNQNWMNTNLSVKYFKNGDPIPEANSKESWVEANENQTPAWCYYQNDSKYESSMGLLYNWYAVNDTRGLASEGFKIPTIEDWLELETFVKQDIGHKLKSKEIYKTNEIWYEIPSYYDYSERCNNCLNASPEYKKICPKCKGTGKMKVKGKYVPSKKYKILEKQHLDGWNGSDEYGFNANPCGSRNSDGSFSEYDTEINTTKELQMWSSSDRDDIKAKTRTITDQPNHFLRYDAHKGCGLSVRCIKE